MNGRVERIRAALEHAFAPAQVTVRDDSAAHAGHAGAATGRGHFSVEIESPAFAGVAPVARHRMVYAALGDMMQTDIHALAISARAPSDAAGPGRRT